VTRSPDERCPVCGATETRWRFRAGDRLYRTTERTFDVVECRGCGLGRLHPQPQPAELARYYPQSYWFAPRADRAGRAAEAYRRLVLRDHVAFARRALAGNRSARPVLDVGCGGGLFLRLLRDHGHRVVGLDSSPQAAAVAWGQQGVPAVCGALVPAPFRPESFAAVTLYHVLEHVPDPAAYLDAARTLLEPGGRLVVQVPDASSWQARLLRERWSGADVPRHLFHFRRDNLERLLRSTGFEILRRKHFSLRDGPAGLATSLAPGLDPMARRIRRLDRSAGTALLRDLAYFGLVLACFPAAAAEAACGCGSTIMVEARKAPPSPPDRDTRRPSRDAS
jgi:SAM-dependent methyltransferase